MKYFEEYKIDDIPLLVPDADVELTQTDLDAGNVGRDEAGFMHRVRLRKRIKSWTFQYSSLTREEFQYLENLLSKNEVFNFSYKDVDGTRKTCSAYCSGTGISYHNAVQGRYRNYKFTINER